MNPSKSILLEATRIVGHELKQNFRGIKEQIIKEGTHYQVADDLKADQIYHEILEKSGIPICSEESMLGKLPDEYWLIDPLEGSTNYSHGNPFFATQGCLIRDNQIIFSVVYAPVFEQFFSAEIGKGATLNNEKIHLSNTTELSKSIISPNKGTGIYNLNWWGNSLSKIAGQVRTVRLFGAVGLELAYVAAGYLDLHYNKGCHPYDDAPGALLVKEAGGTVINFNNKAWTLNDSAIIAGNYPVVKKLAQILNNI